MFKKLKIHILCGALICSFVFAQNARAQIVYKTPQAAAKALFEAWRVKNKAKARTAGDTKAVNKLFGTNYIKTTKFSGCADQSETEKGVFSCGFTDSTDNLYDVGFELVKKGKSWRVRSVTFASEY